MTTNSENDRGICEFCGKRLEEVAINGLNGSRAFTVFKACECDGAVDAERKRIEEEEARKLEEKRKQIEMRYRFAGIPKAYWNAEADDGDHIASIKDGRGLFFTGKSGRGKTYTACSIARKLIAEGWRVRFSDVEGIEREVRSSWGSRETSEDNVIDKYVNADLAIIDDLGAEEMTPTTMKTLRAVISGREANGGVTIFTSNYSRKEFAQHIARESDQVMAQRFASRIAGMTDLVEFTGEDRRLKR